MDRPRRERPQIREEDLPNLAELLAQEQPDLELVEARAAPAPQPRTRKALLLSFVALGVAAMAVLVAVLATGKKEDEPKPPPRVAIKPEGRPDQKPQVQVQPLAPEVLQSRVAAHLGRAKRHLRVGKLRSAQFFLDQVLILDPGHAEAKALMAKLEAKVEERAKLAAAAAEAAAARRARRAAATRRYAAAKKAKPKEEPKKVAAAPKQPEPEEPKKPPPKPAADAKSGELVIRSKPDALVHLDGVPLGSTPMTEVKLAPGRHAVRLRVGGYEPYFKEFDLKPGEQLVLDVQLKPEVELPRKAK